MKDNIIQFFDKNNFKTIQDTGKTWNEIGAEFGMSGEAARKTMKRYWQTPTQTNNVKLKENLQVKSRWEVLGKGGEIVTLTSFKASSNTEGLTAKDVDEVLQKYTKSSSNRIKRVYENKPVANTCQILALGDVHVGMACEDNIFNLKWNKEELFNRAETLIKSVNKEAEYIWLVFGGDICDGQLGKTTRGLKGTSHHSLPQNMDDKKQIDTSCEFITYILDGITASTSSIINCTFITNSNHGGILDYSVGRIMEMACEARYPGRVYWENQNTFLNSYKFKHYNFLLTHGYDDQHMNKGWSRFLSKDNEQFIERYLLSIKNQHPAILLRFDQHQATDIRYVGFRDIVCPAFSNPSSWVSMNFGNDYKGGFMSFEIDDNSIKTELIEF